MATEINTLILDSVLTLSNRDFHDTYEYISPYSCPMGQSNHQTQLTKLSNIEREHLLDSIYDTLLEKYNSDLDIYFLTVRLPLISNYFNKITQLETYTNSNLKTPAHIDFYNEIIRINGHRFEGDIIFFKKMRNLVSSTEHASFWKHTFNLLNNCLLHPVERPDIALDEYFKLGIEMLPILDENLEWWLPMYLGLDILQLPAHQQSIQDLLNIPEKYNFAYTALGMSTAEVYIHYKKTQKLEKIIYEHSDIDLCYNS